MEDLLIEPTAKTPLIDFSLSGKLVIAGSSYPENAKEFFDPVINWATDLQTESIDLDLVLEYMNTASAKKLLELLKQLESNLRIKNLTVNWYYDKEDDDTLEAGQILADTLSRIKFNYKQFEKK
ncbi:MAG: DUF1987 domain-containing protein [Bacteroidales bacterium]|nr:DUF1987 domain-containing protein [Bacteroidales bacterium]